MADQTLTRTETALALRGITAGYGGVTVLRDVSLEIPKGRVVALLGPNGAGKTTLMRVASGLLRPSEGTVSLNGLDVTSRSAARRSRSGVCLVPEGRGIFPSLTVKENIAVQVRPRDRAEAVDKVIDAFPALADRLNQVTGTMSGGQQQMVAMARCYMAAADVMLLDEVSIGLAPLIIDEIYDSVQTLAARGASLLIVEQYVDRVLAIADEVHVLVHGALSFSGPPSSTSREELMKTYLHVVPEA